MNREDILREYRVQEIAAPRILTPGKFEGCPIYAPYFYDMIINGWADSSDGDPENGEYVIDTFKLEPADYVEFPELEKAEYVKCWEDDYGFFYITIVLKKGE